MGNLREGAAALAAAVRDACVAADHFDPDRLDARDTRFIERVLPLCEAFAQRYVRLRADGLEQLRPGPVLYVANHNGGIMGPDLFTTLAVLWRRLGPAAPLYPLAHDFAMRQFTPLGRLLQRAGAMRAAPENARRALEAGGAVLLPRIARGPDAEALVAARAAPPR